MAFQINVTDQQETDIQTYMTYFSMAGTPEEHLQGLIDNILNTDLEAQQKADVIRQIVAIVPSYTGAGKTLQQLQTDLATAQSLAS